MIVPSRTRSAWGCRRLVAFVAAALWLHVGTVPAQTPDPAELYKTKLASAEATLVKELSILLEFAAKQGLGSEAALELRWAHQRVADPAALQLLDAAGAKLAAFTEVDAYLAQGKAWAERRNKLREKVADKYLEIVHWCKSAYSEETDRTVLAGLRIDPDHKGLRKIRGESLLPGCGWVLDKDLANFKKGLVKDGDAWISKAEAAKRHTSWDDPWVIETENFEVRTNLSMDDARLIGRLAEQTYDMFLWLFAGYPEFHVPERKMLVYFLATRGDAVAEREKNHVGQSQIPAQAGGYFEISDLASHFWLATPDRSEFERRTRPNIHHEIAHQLAHHLLHGSIQGDKQRNAEYWAVEGIGACFEDLRDAKTGVTGLWDFQMNTIKDFLKNGLDRSYVPFEKFTRIRAADFYGANEVNHYGQAGLMTLFFLTGEKGKYRARYMTFAAKVDEGGGADGLLSEQLGTPLAQLEKEWLAYARKLAAAGGK